MLAIFRNNPKIVVVIFALVALAFIATGVITREMPGAGAGGGSAGGAIATVGDTTVTPDQLEQQVRTRYTQQAQQQPGLDMPSFLAGGAFSAILDQTIGATALEQYARRLGLTASDKQVGGAMAAVPAFRGPDGQFSQAAYQAVLQQQRLNDQLVRADFAGDILRQMIYLPATGALTLPDGLVAPYANLLLEQRSGAIGFVPAAAMTGGAAPTDAELQDFFKSHLAAYTTPARRVLRYALIGRDQVAAKSVPSDADIHRVYDGNPDKYAARETRDLSQVVLPDEAKAKAFKASLGTGKSFADAARAAGFGAADIAVGAKTQAQYAAQSSPAIAAAAFALPQGGVTDPIRGDLGWTLAKVNTINKIAATPFDKARPQIAADLVKSLQDKALGELVAHVQDAIDKGQGLGDVAKANGLAVVETPPLTAAGLAPDQLGYKAPAEVQPLLAPGFKMSPDDPPSVQTVQANERYALLGVGRTIPAAPVPFAQVRDRVVADFTASRANDRAKAIATAIQAKVKAGAGLSEAFKAAPAKLPDVKPVQARRMELAKLQGNVPPSLARLFSAPVGSTELVPSSGNGDGWYVVHVDGVTPAAPAMLAPGTQSARGDLTQAATNEYLEQLANSAKLAVGTRRDEGAIQATRARLLGAAPAQ